MEIFRSLETADHEQVAFCSNPGVGLRAICCVHQTTLGPAIAGIRARDYSDEDEALTDALVLSEQLTHKAAAAEVNYGGGQVVLLGQPPAQRREAAFRALGRFIQTLGGRLIGAPDVGVTALDLGYVATETEYVAGRSLFAGSYDPSAVTADGVLAAIEVCLERRGHATGLAGRRFAVQGVGAVGSLLAAALSEAGGEVFIHDHNEARQRRVVETNPGLTPLDAEELIATEVDVFCPCGRGGFIDAPYLEKLAGRIVCGAANAQVAPGFTDYAQLAEHDILYAPDFIVNSGGLISVVGELEKRPEDWVFAMNRRIGERLNNVFELSEAEGLSTIEAAERLARRRIEAIASLSHSFIPGERD